MRIKDENHGLDIPPRLSSLAGIVARHSDVCNQGGVCLEKSELESECAIAMIAVRERSRYRLAGSMLYQQS